MGCDAVLSNEWLLMFKRNELPSSQGLSSSSLLCSEDECTKTTSHAFFR